MVGAVEFLRKAKAICEARENCCEDCEEIEKCPMHDICWLHLGGVNESDLVSKVMAYKIEEATE